MGLDIFFHKTTNTEISYFRKVNFLVDYFENILGVDEILNCQNYVVSKKDIEELISRCQLVLLNPELAEKLLPTRPGFFFGNTEYNEHYLKNVQDVLNDMVNNVLPKFDKLDSEESITFSIWY